MSKYDSIIIGSGAGGLTAALALAQAGQNVLVCEQHDVPGGWTHSFTLEGYRFSPGVHYIGGIQPGGTMRHIYEGLGVSADLSFCEINPDGFDHVIIAGERFDIPKGREKYINRLQERFPDEKEGIREYFDAIDGLMGDIARLGRIKGAGSAVKTAVSSPHAIRWGLRSAQAMMDRYLSDPMLKAIVSAQAGDHGMPLSEVSAPVHAGVIRHYYEGGYYPLGGAFAIPRAFVRALKRAGGELRLQTAVSQIIIENGRAIGVELADGEKLMADNIVSNADPEITFGKLIGREHLDRKLVRKLDKVSYSTSALSLFFAVDMDLEAAGLDSGNWWFYDDTDIDGAYKKGLTGEILDMDKPPAMFLTITTLKDPSKKHSGHHTLEAFTFTSYEPFKKWEDQPQGDRDWEYQQLKERLMDAMFAKLDEHVPGLSKHVVFRELGTPLTNANYVNATLGNLYGTDKGVRQMGPLGFPVKTAVSNLYMCGASTLSHGVAGATASGLLAAQQILKCSRRDLLKQNGPELQVYPSEDTSQWPEELQKKIARR